MCKGTINTYSIFLFYFVAGRPLFIERAVARDRFGRVQKEVEDNTLIKEDEIKEEIKEPMLEDDNEKKDILISDIKNMSVDIKEEVLSSG